MKKDKWIWMGHTGHLCVGHSCRFHLSTYVGGYLVSTVGEYFPTNADKVNAIGSGDEDFYETMVFKAVKGKEGCCPFVQESGEGLDCERYGTAREAHKGHHKLCNKWSKRK